MRKLRKITGGIVLAAALALSGGCLFSGPEKEAEPLEVPPGAEKPLTPEQLAEQERRRRIEEEKRRQEAEKRRTAQVRQTLGEVEPPPATGLPGVRPGQAPETLPSLSLLELEPTRALEPGTPLVPFDEAVPALPDEPVLNVVVLGDANDPDKADRVALILGTYSRKTLEEELGMAIHVTYVARVKRNVTRELVIRYRPRFLKAAISVASVLPRPQNLSPMRNEELREQDVHLVVYVGRDFK